MQKVLSYLLKNGVNATVAKNVFKEDVTTLKQMMDKM